MNEIGKVSIKLTADTDNFIKEVKKTISQIEGYKGKLNISADTSSLQNSINKSLQEIGKLKSTKIDITADGSSLSRSVTKATSEISSIKGSSVPINIDNVQALDKVGQIQSRLSILQQRANEISIKPNVNASALSGLELQIASTKSRLESINPSLATKAFNSLQTVGTSTFSSISSSIKQTTDTIRNLALVTSGVVVGAFSLAVKGALDYGGELQQNRGDLEVLLGSQQKALAVLKEQQRFGAQTPFETGDLIKTATNLSTVIKNVDELNLRTKQLGEATGGIPANLSRITNTYTQVVSKGKADTIDIKEFINAGFSQIRIEAQKELGLTGEAFDEALSDGLLTTEKLNNILGRVTAGFPRLAKASQTLPGLFSTATDTLKNFGLALIGIDTGTFELKGGGIAKGISDFLNSFNSDKVVKSLSVFGEKVGSAVASIFGGIDVGNLDISGFVDSLGSGFEQVIKSISEFGKAIKQGFDFVVNSVGGFENFSKILLITATSLGVVTTALAILSVVSSPITLTVLGIAGAVTLLAKYLGDGDIGRGIGRIGDVFGSVFGEIQKYVGVAITYIQNLFKTISSNSYVIDAVASLGDIFSSMFDIFSEVGNLFKFVWNDLGLGNAVMTHIQVSFTAVSIAVYGVIKYVQQLVNDFQLVVKAGADAGRFIYDAFKPFSQALDTAKFFGSIIVGTQNVTTSTQSLNSEIENSKSKFIDLSDGAKLGALGLVDLSDTSLTAEQSSKNLNDAITGLSDTFGKLNDNVISSSEALLRKIDTDERVTKSQKAYDDEVARSGTTSKEATKLFNQLSSAKLQQSKANDTLSKTNQKLQTDTEKFIEELQKQPGLINAVKLADIQKNIALTNNAIDLAKRNGENFDALEKNRLKLIELSRTPANIVVTADTTLANIATDTLKQKVLNSGGTINIDGSITRGLEKTNELVQIINGKVGTVSVGLSNPAKSVVDNLIDNIQANIGKRTVYISSAFAPTTGSLAGIFDRKQYGGIIKGFATGGRVGTDTVPAMLTPGEYVINADSTKKFQKELEMINSSPQKYGEYIRNISSNRSSVINNNQGDSKINNFNVNISGNIEKGIQRTVSNIGYLLQSELQNRGV